LPRLAWMGVGLFACNLIVMGGAALSPELQVGVYGDESNRAYADAKPSPFTEIIDNYSRNKRLRLPVC